MLTNEQLAQLETRLLERLRGEDGDLAVLLAHVAQLQAERDEYKRRIEHLFSTHKNNTVNWPEY